MQLSKERRINKVKVADKEGAENAARTVEDISTSLILCAEMLGKVP